MPGVKKCRTVSTVIASVLLVAFAGSAFAQIKLDLPSQPLERSLTAIGSLAHVNVLFDSAAVEGLQAPAIKMESTVDDALAKILAGTELHAVRVDENTVRVIDSGASERQRSAHRAETGENYNASKSQTAYAGKRVASAEVPAATDANDSGRGTENMGRDIQQVVVTAEKRSERLEDVPVPVSVISAGNLVDYNQPHLQDYYNSVPGLDLAVDNRGAPTLAIRGITTTIYGNPTVGVIIDDVPYGATTSAAFQWAATEFDPNELSKIEVLRGPQGTLYGASSLGGLIKYDTIDPSTESASARFEAGLTNVYNGNTPGYSIEGAANIPLSDDFALRVSAFNRIDPGYITNITTGESGVNWGTVNGARLSTLWKPSDAFSLKFSALIQRGLTHGSPNIETQSGFGDFQQQYVRGTGGYDRLLEAYNVTAHARLGLFDLTSITGFGVSTSSGSFDVSSLDFVRNVTVTQFGTPGVAWVENNRTNKISQELRLSVPIGARLEWLLGGFYTHEHTNLNGGFQAFDPTTGIQAGKWFNQYGPVSYEEYAAFTDLTFHFTDSFDVQVGGRESENRQTFSQVLAGPWASVVLGGTSPIVSPEFSSKDNSFTYLVTPRLKLTPNLMVYARLASGYRPGSPNTTVTPGSGLPLSYGPDKTENYELGIKANFFDRRLSIDASGFYIDWKDIQITISDTSNAESYATNLGQAKSQGAELSIQAKPFRGFTVAAWGAWTDAQLTKAFPPTSLAVGAPGERLPYSAKLSGSLTLREEVELKDDMTGFAAATASYVGDRLGEFSAGFGAGRQVYPAYTRTDLRAGTTYHSWTTSVYVNNILNERGMIAGGLGTLNPNAFTYIQPRTIGATVSKEF